MLTDLTTDRTGPIFPPCQALCVTPTRILLVDDDNDIRGLLNLSLSLVPDFVTRSCSSGKEALNVAADWIPHLILLDVMMPEMGGVATLARLRLRIDSQSRIPVVFMTGLHRAQQPEYYRSLGAAGVIFKPFEPAALADLVRKYLHRQANLSGSDPHTTVVATMALL